MTRDIVTVAPNTPLRVILDLMRQHGLNALPVVDGPRSQRRLTGMISDTDLVRAAGDRHPGDDAERLMTTAVVSVGPGGTLEEAVALMHANGVNNLPVVDSGGELLGMVSPTDLLKPFLHSNPSREFSAQR